MLVFKKLGNLAFWMHWNFAGMLEIEPEDDQIGKNIGEIGKEARNRLEFLELCITYLKIDNLCSFRISDKAIRPGIMQSKIGSFWLSNAF